MLLTATAMGLASCPVTEPLEIAETREAVRAEVFGDSSYPQMLLRVGWAPINADPLPATPRRPLAEIVEWLSDSDPIPSAGASMPGFLRSSDAFIWSIESDPCLRSTIVVLVLLDRPPDWRELTKRFELLSRVVRRLGNRWSRHRG